MKQERFRKARMGINTHPFTLKLDIDIYEYLKTKPNMGRYINNLIRRDMNTEPISL